MTRSEAGSAGARPCAICGKPAVARYRPFCSRRCADIDLGRWLKGDYRIPTSDAPSEPEADSTGSGGGKPDHD